MNSKRPFVRDGPTPYTLVRDPEELDQAMMSTMLSDEFVVPLRSYYGLKKSLMASSSNLKSTQAALNTLENASLRKTDIQEKLLIKFKSNLKALDEVTDNSLYVSLRDLETKVLDVVKYVDSIKAEFLDQGVIMNDTQVREGFTTISSLLDRAEPDSFLNTLFSGLDIEFEREDWGFNGKM